MCINIWKSKIQVEHIQAYSEALNSKSATLEVGLTKLAAVLTVTKSSSRPLKYSRKWRNT